MTSMLFAIATAAESSSGSASDPVGLVVFAMLLVAIGGLARLGVRERRNPPLTYEDLDWVSLED